MDRGQVTVEGPATLPWAVKVSRIADVLQREFEDADVVRPEWRQRLETIAERVLVAIGDANV